MKKVNEKVFYQSDTVKGPLTWQKVETIKFENINLVKREKKKKMVLFSHCFFVLASGHKLHKSLEVPPSTHVASGLRLVSKHLK